MTTTCTTQRACLSLRHHLSEVARARSYVRNVATLMGFDEERVFDIALACSEATANAIEHGSDEGGVTIRAMGHSNRLEVQVRGTGDFHMRRKPGARESRRLGLPLMVKLSDTLTISSGVDRGTSVSLTFFLKPERAVDC